MANFRAPGVYITERDLSEVVAPAGTSVGALVGPAYNGPTNRRVLVTNNQEFIQTFGVPVSGTVEETHYYAALEFLKESGFMWYTRTTTSADTVGVVTISGTSATSTTVAEGATTVLAADSEYADGNKADKYYAIEEQTYPLIIGALGPGSYSKDIAVSIVTSADQTTTSASEFGYNIVGKYPDTYPYYKINVYVKNTTSTNDDAGWTTGTSAISASTAPAPTESYVVSNNPLAKDYNGKSIYVKDVINGISKFIYANTNGTDISSNGYATSGIIPLGTGSYTFSHAGTASGWSWLYASREAVQPNILMGAYDPDTSNVNASAAIASVISIANSRRDCIAVVPVGTINQAPTDIVAAKSSIAGNNSSYVALYTGWDLIADTYSSKRIYIPKVVFAGALLARTDRVANTWDAPAGLSRGTLPVIDQYRIFSEQDIGYMYNYNINTSKRIRGVGDIMWGQKTGQVKTTALDRINVRRLLLFIENTIEPSLQDYLFEPNNERTRSRVQSNISDFLQTIFAGGGVTNYQVVCDESNNTSQVIDNNELAVDLFITPTRTIEFINVRVTITRTGVSFAEL